MTTSVKEDEFEAAERTWFHEQGTEMESKDPARLAGLDASLQWLTQLWNSTLHSSPYNGILSFSAGSALSAMLPLIRTPHLQFHGLSFMILISGYIPTPPPDAGFGGVRREDHYGVDVVNVPTLHVVGAANEVVRPEESLEISRRFVDPVVYTHPYGHCLPSTLECFTVVGSFLSLRYGEIFGGREGEVRERFLMQSRLKKLELYASSMLASSSSLSPPRALMAVIDRNAVGGWSGGRRDKPGGGAPCPVEFVKKEKERREGGDRRKPDGRKGGGGGRKLHPCSNGCDRLLR